MTSDPCDKVYDSPLVLSWLYISSICWLYRTYAAQTFGFARNKRTWVCTCGESLYINRSSSAAWVRTNWGCRTGSTYICELGSFHEQVGQSWGGVTHMFDSQTWIILKLTVVPVAPSLRYDSCAILVRFFPEALFISSPSWLSNCGTAKYRYTKIR